VTQPNPVTTPGPFGNVHILTLPGTFLMIPIGAIWLLAAPWATRAANALDRLLIRELLGPASLSQRVHELEQTRAYAVDDSAARLRGIERDLHDGTQAQLVAVAMKLGLAMKKLGTSDDVAGSELDLERARRRRSRPSPTTARPSYWPTWPSTAAPGTPRSRLFSCPDCCGSASPTTAQETPA